MVILSNMSKEEILKLAKVKLKCNDIVSLRTVEKLIKAEEAEEFVAETTYFALTEEEEEESIA